MNFYALIQSVLKRVLCYTNEVGVVFVIFGAVALEIYTKLGCTQLLSNGQDALTLQLYDAHVALAIFSFNIFLYTFSFNIF